MVLLDKNLGVYKKYLRIQGHFQNFSVSLDNEFFDFFPGPNFQRTKVMD